MSDVAKTMVKFAMLAKILEAARLLYELGLQEEAPNETVRRYVLANPDINEALARAGSPMVREHKDELKEMKMSSTANPTPKCPYCGFWPHDSVGQCPAVKSIEYFPNGAIKRVEKREDQSLFKRVFGSDS
jgi:hypothetical protein